MEWKMITGGLWQSGDYRAMNHPRIFPRAWFLVRGRGQDERTIGSFKTLSEAIAACTVDYETQAAEDELARERGYPVR